MQIVIEDNSLLPGWPKETKDEEQNKQNLVIINKIQSQLTYKYCQGSENLSYRREIIKIWGTVSHVYERYDGKKDRTIFYNDLPCPKLKEGEKLIIEVKLVYGSWSEDSLGSVRYVYLKRKNK